MTTLAAVLFVLALSMVAVAVLVAFQWFLFYWRAPIRQTELERKRHAWWSLDE